MRERDVHFGHKLSETTIRCAEEQSSTITTAEIGILVGASQAKIRRSEQNAAVLVKLQSVIQVCLKPNPVPVNSKDVISQYNSIISAAANDMQDIKPSAVKHVAAVMEYMELQNHYLRQIEALQTKIFNFQAESEDLRMQLQNRNINDNIPEVALKIACLMRDKDNAKQEPFLQILSDLICNKDKASKRWTDEVAFYNHSRLWGTSIG